MGRRVATLPGVEASWNVSIATGLTMFDLTETRLLYKWMPRKWKKTCRLLDCRLAVVSLPASVVGGVGFQELFVLWPATAR